jgi:hypothetical protein
VAARASCGLLRTSRCWRTRRRAWSRCGNSARRTPLVFHRGIVFRPFQRGLCFDLERVPSCCVRIARALCWLGLGGVSQYAIRKYAETLETIPRTLAENAGQVFKPQTPAIGGLATRPRQLLRIPPQPAPRSAPCLGSLRSTSYDRTRHRRCRTCTRHTRRATSTVASTWRPAVRPRPALACAFRRSRPGSPAWRLANSCAVRLRTGCFGFNFGWLRPQSDRCEWWAGLSRHDGHAAGQGAGPPRVKGTERVLHLQSTLQWKWWTEVPPAKCLSESG